MPTLQDAMGYRHAGAARGRHECRPYRARWDAAVLALHAVGINADLIQCNLWEQF